jgi:subtilase family serine protease
MTRVDLKKSSARRRPTPAFDRLEGRAMLTASTITHLALAPLFSQANHQMAVAITDPSSQGSTSTHHVNGVHVLATEKTAQVAKHTTTTAHVVKPTHAVKKVVKPTHVAKKVVKPTHAVKKVVTPTHAVKKVVTPTHAVKVKASKVPLAHQSAEWSGFDATSPVPGFLTPAQVRTAYGITSLPNQGQGTTIGIDAVFIDPAIKNDLATFSATYGLPQLDGLNGHGAFTSLAQAGTPNSPSDGSNNDTSGETAIDVEWAHSLAPLANIVLYQVKSFAYTDLLAGVQFLVGMPGVSTVSVSYGGSEFSGETSFQSFFTTPFGSNPSPVAIDFSTGDDSFPGFPATSPSVLAVGGTGLYIATTRGRYGFETAWGGVSGQGAGGGGVSTQYGAPTFQSANGVSFSGRAIPDISAVADILTSVSVLNSWDSPSSPWTGFGGTSVATPIVSGMIDLAQETRINMGLLTLSSPQINAKLYAAYTNPTLYASLFHDITVGNNTEVGGTTGFSAVTGYDRATGLGSPIGNDLVAYLASP